MSVSCQLVLQHLRAICPPLLALDGDPTGLQVGSADKSVERVLLCLDLTLEVALEARARGAGLVISHHAVIFRPLKDLCTDSVRGRILEQLIQGQVAVYVPHTATDVTDGGINDYLATLLGLEQTRYLKETRRDPHSLLRIELGATAAHAGTDALVATARHAGAEQVWASESVFEALAAAGERQRVARALGRAGATPHVVPLAEPCVCHGIGRIGYLTRPASAQELAHTVKQRLGAPMLRVVARDLQRPLTKIAVLAGDGRSFIDAAVFAGADAMLTGDVDHHTALEALHRDLVLLDAGHWATEQHVPELLATALRQRLDQEPVEILTSTVCTQPFHYV